MRNTLPALPQPLAPLSGSLSPCASGYDMNKGTPLAESDAPLAGLAAGVKQYLDLGVAPHKLVLGQ